MGNRKSSKKYFFSVEGETEEWYLLWLRDLINSTDHAAYKVSIDCKIEKDPLKRAKGLVNTSKTEIYHFFDYKRMRLCMAGRGLSMLLAPLHTKTCNHY